MNEEEREKIPRIRLITQITEKEFLRIRAFKIPLLGVDLTALWSKTGWVSILNCKV